MFNVYRFISTTVNAAALTSALQTLLALATVRHSRRRRWQRRRCKFLFTKARHDVANENVATIDLAYIVCNYLLVLGKADKAISLH